MGRKPPAKDAGCARSGLPRHYGDREWRKTPRSPDTGQKSRGADRGREALATEVQPQSALVTLPFCAAQGWREQLRSAQHHKHPTSLPSTMGVEHVTALKNGSLSSSPLWEMQWATPGLGVNFGIRAQLCVMGTNPTWIGLWHTTGSCAAASVSPLCSKHSIPRGAAVSPTQGDAPGTSASSSRNVSGVCMSPWFKHSTTGSPPGEIFTQLSCSQPSCWPSCQHQPVPRALCAFNKHRSFSPCHVAPSRLPQGIVVH